MQKVGQQIRNRIAKFVRPTLVAFAREFLHDELRRHREEILREWQRLELIMIRDVSDRLLSTREAISRRWRAVPLDRPISPPKPRNLDEDFVLLQREFPSVFPVWTELFENAKKEYERDPQSNLSVEGNVGAEAFRKYLAPEMRGRVLDIGCGPQSLPRYLEGFSNVRIAGIDPLPGTGEREFQFVGGVAEFLPWPDGEFNVVVAATSLDHTISLDKVFSEICRVLADEGVCVVWVGFVAGAPRYNPYAEHVSPIDQYHIFHFDRPWFIELVSKYFRVIDEFKLDYMNHFYTLEPIR